MARIISDARYEAIRLEAKIEALRLAAVRAEHLELRPREIADVQMWLTIQADTLQHMLGVIQRRARL